MVSSRRLQSHRPRAREVGIAPGILPTGPLNSITDVADVLVGHVTLIEGDDVRTGVTAIRPHGANLYESRVPAGLAVGNGFGKLSGSTQIVELGEIETPMVLTNTLSVPQAAAAIVDWTLNYPGNEQVRSVNPVVGETNDGWLNAIRRRSVTSAMVLEAIDTADGDSVEEGCLGAGTGTVALGWKGGIGTSSRLLSSSPGAYTVGVLVQSNFGGVLQVLGVPVGKLLGRHYLAADVSQADGDGSIMIVVATDAPLSDRNLERLARRALAGLARTGASMTNGSGDYVIAFSTAESVRRTLERRSGLAVTTELPNDCVSPLFQAVIEATEEAIYNSLFRAVDTRGIGGRMVRALPLEQVLPLIGRAD